MNFEMRADFRLTGWGVAFEADSRGPVTKQSGLVCQRVLVLYYRLMSPIVFAPAMSAAVRAAKRKRDQANKRQSPSAKQQVQPKKRSAK